MKIGAKIFKVCQGRLLPTGREVLPKCGGGRGRGPVRSRATPSGVARISGARPSGRYGYFPVHEIGTCALAFGVHMAAPVHGQIRRRLADEERKYVVVRN